MATAKEIKQNLRAHIEMRMRDARTSAPFPEFQRYADYAYGAIWAASWGNAISDAERDQLLNELRDISTKVPA